MKHVVIVGGGFAGLNCAKKLAKHSDVRVTLIDKNNYQQFQPLLYQVAAADLSPTNVAFSLRGVILRDHPNVDVKMAEVVSVDLDTRTVHTAEGQTYHGDFLVLAAGSQPNFFGTPGADKHSYPLYSLHDAEALRSRIIAVLECADRDPSVLAKGALNFVIVGAGPTGTEMAGAFGDGIHRALSKSFPDLNFGGGGSASPNAIAINQSATISINATSPESRPLTYAWTSTGGQLSGNGTSATLVATNADAGNTITVTGTATDDHNLSTSCTASVTVPQVQKVAEVEDWGECTFEKNPKKPWRVDNDCKDVLDKLALRVQQMPNGKVAIVGYTDQEEVVNAEQLGAQRSVKVKYYLTTDEIGPKLDPTRLEARQGGKKGKKAHFYFVPQGATFSEEESVTVDETVVQGQSRSAPAPKKAKKASAPPPNQ